MATGDRLDSLLLAAGGDISVMSRTLRGAVISLLVTCRRWSYGRIRWPDNDLAEELASSVTDRLPYIKDMIGVLDGQVVACEHHQDAQVETANHNGKSGATAKKVSSSSFAALFIQEVLLVFLMDGTVPSFCAHMPGVNHDANLLLHLRLEEKMVHLHRRFKIAG